MLGLEFVAEACRWLKYADAAYKVSGKGTDEERVTWALEGRGTCSFACLGSSVGRPGHFVAIDTERRVIVLCCKGTSSTSDAITNSAGKSVVVSEFPDIEAHQGILQSARAILKHCLPSLRSALLGYPGFSVVVSGHSLGAGTAILCTLLLQLELLPGAPRVRCFAFAPPAVVSSLAAPCVAAIEVYAFINRYDIIPRVSTRALMVLAAEAIAVDSLDIGVSRVSGRLGVTLPRAKQQRVCSAIDQARREANESRRQSAVIPHFIPGRIFWMGNVSLDSPVVQGAALTTSEDPDEPGVDQASLEWKMIESSSEHFQEILLRGGASMFSDHKTGRYRQALLGVMETLDKQNDYLAKHCVKERFAQWERLLEREQPADFRGRLLELVQREKGGCPDFGLPPQIDTPARKSSILSHSEQERGGERRRESGSVRFLNAGAAFS